MPRMTGLQAAREIAARGDGVRVLMLSMHDNEQYFFQALRAGASGYLLKTAAERDLVAACRAAMRGEAFLFPAAVRAVVRDYLQRAADGEEIAPDPLSARETEIVKLVGEGHSTREIAEALVIAEKTVERHRSRIFEKLGLHDRVALTRWAIRRGLVDP
jgi:DNA-binding NarL/FixJ family response regulator